jgi:hypothetical protein
VPVRCQAAPRSGFFYARFPTELHEAAFVERHRDRVIFSANAAIFARRLLAEV